MAMTAGKGRRQRSRLERGRSEVGAVPDGQRCYPRRRSGCGG